LTEEQVFSGNYNSKDKKRDPNATGYFYRAKSPAGAKKVEPTSDSTDKNVEGKKGEKPSANKMANLLSCLKAESGADNTNYNKYIGAPNSDDEEDEDVSNVVERRQSMNTYNEAGMNFQKYQDIKPAAGVRREILNMFNEYKEMEDKQHAEEELIAICKQYDLQRFQFVGYFLSNSLAEKPNDFRQYVELVFNCFHIEKQLLNKEEMKER